jgi:hypothetical protein
MGWEDLARIDVEKSSSHQLSHSEIGSDNPVLDIYLRTLIHSDPVTCDKACYQHPRTNIREARLHEPKIGQAVGLAADDYPEKNLWGVGGFKQLMNGCGPCVFASPANLRVQGR